MYTVHTFGIGITVVACVDTEAWLSQVIVTITGLKQDLALLATYHSAHQNESETIFIYFLLWGITFKYLI